jgi:hypothetical protein
MPDSLKAVHKGFSVGLRTPARVTGRLNLLVCQAFEHQADHAQVDPGLTGTVESLHFFADTVETFTSAHAGLAKGYRESPRLKHGHGLTRCGHSG